MTMCPVCRGTKSLGFERRPRVPLLQNRVWPDATSARAAPEGALDMRACETCGFVWNDAFDSSRNIYDEAYDNDQMQSPHFREHTDAMLRAILEGLPQRPVHLVEVGCGQGAFIARLAREARPRFASLTGFDPAWRGEHAISGVRLHNCYFGPQALPLIGAPAEAVVSRHTIEHVPDPLAFLETMRASMSEDREARLFLETPDVEWIFRNFQLQDLFYEHCSLFSPDSIATALEAAGFEPIRISKVFGEQYLWAEARPGARIAAGQGSREAHDALGAEAARFAERRKEIIDAWRSLVEARAGASDVWLWGASSKGVTFAALVDPDATWLKGAIDINPNKAGRFMPVTGLPIAAPEALRGGDVVIVMNPNYKAEIARDIERMGKRAEILCLGEF
jgi:SAM-dependent methyltransferase